MCLAPTLCCSVFQIVNGLVPYSPVSYNWTNGSYVLSAGCIGNLICNFVYIIWMSHDSRYILLSHQNQGVAPLALEPGGSVDGTAEVEVVVAQGSKPSSN